MKARPTTLIFWFTLGVSAAFRDLQIGSVHLFSALAAVAFVACIRRATPRPLAPVLVLSLSVVLLSLTTFLGDLVVNDLLWVQLCVLAASASAIYLVANAEQTLWVARGVVGGASISSLFALAQQFGLLRVELYFDSSGLYRPTGLVHEPDWVGAFAGVALILLARSAVSRGWLAWSLVAVNAGALLFSFARAAWVGVGIVVVIWLIAWRKQRSRSSFPLILSGKSILIVASLGVVALASSPSLLAIAQTRLLSIFYEEHRDLNAIYREQQFDGLIQLIETAPWYGHGLSASGRVTDFGLFQSGAADRAVASNWVLGLVLDGMLLAVPLIVFLCWTAARGILTAFGQVLIFVLVNSLFSNLLFSPVLWLAVALSLTQDGTVGRPAPRREGLARKGLMR